MLDAVLFDFDGVIADSEPVHRDAIRAIAATVGVTISDDDYQTTYIGFDDRDAFREVLRQAGQPIDKDMVAAMCKAKATEFDRLAEQGVPPIAGAIELARAIKAADVPMAIGSGATRHEIDLMLDGLNARGLFTVFATADDVAQSKPDPQTYLLALERLAADAGRAIDPARTVVIEDTAAGVASARAAGLRVVGITTTGPADRLADADAVWDGLAGKSLDDLRSVASNG
jgi:beta-phosphoglucomutase